MAMKAGGAPWCRSVLPMTTSRAGGRPPSATTTPRVGGIGGRRRWRATAETHGSCACAIILSVKRKELNNLMPFTLFLFPGSFRLAGLNERGNEVRKWEQQHDYSHKEPRRGYQLSSNAGVGERSNEIAVGNRVRSPRRGATAGPANCSGDAGDCARSKK